MNLYFDFYSVAVEIAIDSPELLNSLKTQLQADFHYFETAAFQTSKIHIQVLPAQPFSLAGKACFQTGLCKAYQQNGLRICSFQEGSTLVDDSSSHARSAKYYAANNDQAYEGLYYYILSSVGEALDRKGLHRLHAVAYQESGVSYCLYADSKNGKTARALKILAHTNCQLFGDELVLTDGNSIFPFPIRLAARPDIYTQFADYLPATDFTRSLGGRKFLVGIPNPRVAKGTKDFKLYISNSGIWNQYLFAGKFLLGLGIPQMREFMIRPNNLGSLLKILVLRVRCLFRLLRKIETKTVFPIQSNQV